MPAADVARSVVRAVERGHAETFVPALLRQAQVAKSLVPPLFRWGAARVFAEELAAQRRSR